MNEQQHKPGAWNAPAQRYVLVPVCAICRESRPPLRKFGEAYFCELHIPEEFKRQAKLTRRQRRQFRK